MTFIFSERLHKTPTITLVRNYLPFRVQPSCRHYTVPPLCVAEPRVMAEAIGLLCCLFDLYCCSRTLHRWLTKDNRQTVVHMLILEKPDKDADVGVVLHSVMGVVTVQHVVSDLPAAAAGLLAGDTIKLVGGQAAPDTAPEVIDLLKAAEAGPLQLTIERKERVKKVATAVAPSS
jgi:hypothetical protein